MALDGVFIKKLTAELQQAVGAHIDKIHQPSSDALVLLLRKSGFAKRLFICAKQGSQRIHFTDMKFENPENPPMFCMLLRKYVGSGRILSVTQPDYERLVEISFSALNEMGDVITPKLIVELISASPNIILVGEGGKIIDALKRSSLENGGRILMPGAVYEYPQRQNKFAPEAENLDKITAALTDGRERALLNNVAGFSPIICREIAEGHYSLSEVFNVIKKQDTPFIIKAPNGEAFDFSYLPIKQYTGYVIKKAESFSSLLDDFYSSRTKAALLKQRSQDLERLLDNLKTKIKKRMNLRLQDLQNCKKKEEFRIFGELLKANLHLAKTGMKSITVRNFYEEDLAEIKIPLNPALSPKENAAKFFKDYKKAHTAEDTLSLLIEADQKELSYIESVAFSLSSVKTVKEAEEIREELITAGYIRDRKHKKQNKVDNTFNEAVSPSGYRIFIGKNNRQNDLLTLSIATKGDMWFHTKNIPGSHVIVQCLGEELKNEDILFAARLAAKHSKAAASSQVPVDYTRVKYVKKPNGAKPGMVIYTNNNTVYVNPNEVLDDKN